MIMTQHGPVEGAVIVLDKSLEHLRSMTRFSVGGDPRITDMHRQEIRKMALIAMKTEEYQKRRSIPNSDLPADLLLKRLFRTYDQTGHASVENILQINQAFAAE